MEELMKQLAEDIREIRSSQLKMTEVLAKNTSSLEMHIKRTDILESKITPIERHASIVSWLSKVGLGIIVGTAVQFLVKKIIF